MKNIHGGDIYKYKNGIIDFSSNISPLGISDNIINAVTQSIPDIIHYPDIYCGKLRKKLADTQNVAYDSIFLGNGAAEIIYNIILCIKPKRALFTAPTFAEYERASDIAGSQKLYCYLKEENNFDIGYDILNYIDNSLDIIFICNPNNPTGRCVKKEDIINITKSARKNNTFVVVDECFMDFVSDSDKYSVKQYIKSYDNLIILKSFTKLYAIPGIRLGYALCGNKALLEGMYDTRQPWSVSVPAQVAGLAALDDTELPQRVREYINQERKYLCDNFEAMNITYLSSKANYIMFKADTDIDKRLLSHNILIRNCSNYRGLGNGCFRIAVKSHSENEALIQALRSEMGDNLNG